MQIIKELGCSGVQLLSLNNVLRDFCFDYHPSEVGKKGLALKSIDWQNLHELLLKEICNRFKEMKEN